MSLRLSLPVITGRSAHTALDTVGAGPAAAAGWRSYTRTAGTAVSTTVEPSDCPDSLEPLMLSVQCTQPSGGVSRRLGVPSDAGPVLARIRLRVRSGRVLLGIGDGAATAAAVAVEAASAWQIVDVPAPRATDRTLAVLCDAPRTDLSLVEVVVLPADAIRVATQPLRGPRTVAPAGVAAVASASAPAPAAAPRLQAMLTKGPGGPSGPRGPRPKDVPGSLTLTSSAPLGQVGQVGGTVSPGTTWVAGPDDWEPVPAATFSGEITVTFDSGESATGAIKGSSWTSANITFTRPGVRMGTASVKTTAGATFRSTAVAFVSGTPTLTVATPANDQAVPLSRTGAEVPVRATTPNSTDFGGVSVSVEWGAVDTSGNPVRAALAADGGAAGGWAGSVHLDPLPLGTRTISVTAVSVAAPQAFTTVGVQVRGQDAAPPDITVISPPPNHRVVRDGANRVLVQGRTDDRRGSGISGGVEVALSAAGPWTAATPAGLDDWSSWSAEVEVAAVGPFVVVIRAQDAAGNQTTLDWPLEAISAWTPASLDDRLSPPQYLAALTRLAQDHVTTPADPVSATDLATCLGQPLDRLGIPDTPAASAGARAVNELRVPVELARAEIAASGMPPGPGAQGEAAYRWAAYQALLVAIGTSYTELRLARGADAPTRGALASRLGITLTGQAGSGADRPDQLDALMLDDSTLTEPALEQLFRLPDTAAGLDPLRIVPPGQLFGWQIATQDAGWRAADDTQPVPLAYTAVVDPDVITADDVLATSPDAATVLRLLAVRAADLGAQVTAFQAAVTGAADTPAKFAALLIAGLPGGAASLADWQSQDAHGGDISAALADAGLDRVGFTYLAQLKAVTAVAEVTADEWSTATDILVGAYRRRQYPAWRATEADVVLSPTVFGGAGAAPALSAYRVDPQARVDWIRTLSVRSVERQGLTTACDGAISTAERAALPILRDGLVAVVGAATGMDGADHLSRRYQLDFLAGGTVTTSRLAQATAAVQDLLELVRSGDVAAESSAHDWTLSIGPAAFDAAFAAIGGGIDSWRQATTAFLFPEAFLDPALLTGRCSGAYTALCTALLDFKVDPDGLQKAIDTYSAAATAAGVSDLTALTYLSGRDRAHQQQLAAWAAARDAGNVFGAFSALEVFWAAPMLAAQAMTAAGWYQVALDWLWVVFPFNDPAAVSCSARVNGEVAAGPNSPDLTFPIDWAEHLDPFGLVAGRPAPYLRATLLSLASTLLVYGDAEFTTGTDASIGHARTLYQTAARVLDHPRLAPVDAGPGEGALPLPPLDSLRQRVQVQLTKIRQGRNVAGLARTVAGGSGRNAIAQPTPYRYKVLLARAQQLSAQAAQFEAVYLSLLEKYDTGTLRLSDARYAAEICQLQLTVHSAQVQEADDAAAAADDQKAKTDSVLKSVSDALTTGPNQYEAALLGEYPQMRNAQDAAARAETAASIAGAAATAADAFKQTFSFGAAAVATGVQIAALGFRLDNQVSINDLQSQIQANQLQEGIEIRREDLGRQQVAASADVTIAAAAQQTSRDQQAIAADEQAVAQKQNDQAAATLALLTTQFTNPNLYRWMSEALGSVYRYFLQTATATARLAQSQLAFERAELPQTVVADDYWQPPASLVAADSDTRGMTGAERLSQDLQRLSDYAFGADARLLNVSQTFSLAQLLPLDFMVFRQTGQLSFATPAAWFDQQFPGHIQRLIRRVAVSVVALIPPSQGIRATLTSTGISRVTTAQGLGLYGDVVLRGSPSVISVTSPLSATGVFDPDDDPDMLLPFEGSGVDMSWQLDMPPAANPFDYSTVADVLLRVDYTAIADNDRRGQLVHQMNADRSRQSDCVFSLVRDFPDQWYTLLNPGDQAGVRTARIPLGPTDFPAGLTGLSVTAVGVRAVGDTSLPALNVTLNLSDGDIAIGGTATTGADGVASTRRGAAGWNPLLGQDPVATWTLSLDSTADAPFGTDAIEDILLVVSWSGQAPRWAE